MKVLIKHLRADTAGNSNEPLKTAKLREMETQQSHLSLLNRYKTIVIRVQFPNRYVLQGQFTPYETIGSVVEFVRQYLLDTVGDFYLCKYHFLCNDFVAQIKLNNSYEPILCLIHQLLLHQRRFCPI